MQALELERVPEQGPELELERVQVLERAQVLSPVLSMKSSGLWCLGLP